MHTSDSEALRRVRNASLPHPLTEDVSDRDYLYHPLRPGEKLRQSLWLDALDGMAAVELVLSFGASSATDWSDRTGRGLMLQVGDFRATLADLGAWPPAAPQPGATENAPGSGNRVCTVSLAPDVFRPHRVNWIELHQNSATRLYAPCVPAAMEPYVAPLWTETEDAFQPPRA